MKKFGGKFAIIALATLCGLAALWPPQKKLKLGTSRYVASWSDGGVGIVALNNLQGAMEKLATNCAEKFGNKWLAGNPKRR